MLLFPVQVSTIVFQKTVSRKLQVPENSVKSLFQYSHVKEQSVVMKMRYRPGLYDVHLESYKLQVIQNPPKPSGKKDGFLWGLLRCNTTSWSAEWRLMIFRTRCSFRWVYWSTFLSTCCRSWKFPERGFLKNFSNKLLFEMLIYILFGSLFLGWGWKNFS
jgi:hypothetical protein